jgi:fatty acid desaturase
MAKIGEKLRYIDTKTGNRKPQNETQKVKTRRIAAFFGVSVVVAWSMVLHSIVAPWPATLFVLVLTLPFAVAALVLIVAAVAYLGSLGTSAAKRVDEAFFK